MPDLVQADQGQRAANENGSNYNRCSMVLEKRVILDRWAAQKSCGENRSSQKQQASNRERIQAPDDCLRDNQKSNPNQRILVTVKNFDSRQKDEPGPAEMQKSQRHDTPAHKPAGEKPGRHRQCKVAGRKGKSL